MKNRCFPFIPLTLCLVVVLLILGCQSSVPTNTPTGQTRYPADISGHVTIVGFLRAQGSVYSPPNNETYWVVDIVFTNNGYEITGPPPAPTNAPTEQPRDPDISGYDHWNVVAGGKYYRIPELLDMDKPPLLTVPIGQTKKTVVCFQVPGNLKLSDAQLYYQAQKVVSLGPLTGGEKAAGYDWDLKTIVNK
jgi:hypothetical protein